MGRGVEAESMRERNRISVAGKPLGQSSFPLATLDGLGQVSRQAISTSRCVGAQTRLVKT